MVSNLLLLGILLAFVWVGNGVHGQWRFKQARAAERAAAVMIRLDGYRGAVLVEKMARGRKWDFEKDD